MHPGGLFGQGLGLVFKRRAMPSISSICLSIDLAAYFHRYSHPLEVCNCIDFGVSSGIFLVARLKCLSDYSNSVNLLVSVAAPKSTVGRW
jgi:hypothetical protein